MRAFVSSFAIAAWFVALPAGAVNAKIEAAAKTAIDKAAAEISGGKLDAAMKRLQTALAACGVDKCTAQTKAALMRDSAAVEFKRGDKEAGTNGLVQAFTVDPNLEVSDKYDVPELRNEWAPAKEEAAATKGPPPKGGDFSHTPPAEQTVATPLPLYVEYTGSSKPARVTLKYRGTGMSEFKRIPFAKKGDGWAVTVPCGDVKRGGVRYYIEAYDQTGDIVGTSGSASQPYGVPIRVKISGSAPSLPGASAPKPCTGGGSSDAPTTPSGEAGAACTESSECKSGKCNDGVCATASEKKKESSDDYARIWIGVAGSLDFVSLPAGDDVCKRNPVGVALNGVYYCTTPADGSNYPTGPNDNDTLVKGKSGSTGGGFVPANIRVMATIDFAATSNLLIGGRLGYVINRYPGSDSIVLGHGLRAPVHFEVRLTYVIGDAPLAHAGVAPYVFAGGGVTEFDASASVNVQPTGVPGALAKDAWLTAGPWFVAAGGGVRYAFSPRAAGMLGLRVAGAPGPSGFMPILAPELALQYGF